MKIALLILRIYLLGMLALILLKFFVFTSPLDVGGGPHAGPTSRPATAPVSQLGPASLPGSR